MIRCLTLLNEVIIGLAGDGVVWVLCDAGYLYLSHALGSFFFSLVGFLSRRTKRGSRRLKVYGLRTDCCAGRISVLNCVLRWSFRLCLCVVIKLWADFVIAGVVSFGFGNIFADIVVVIVIVSCRRYRLSLSAIVMLNCCRWHYRGFLSLSLSISLSLSASLSSSVSVSVSISLWPSLSLSLSISRSCRSSGAGRTLNEYQVATLEARLDGKDMELEAIKEDNADLLQKVRSNSSSTLFFYYYCLFYLLFSIKSTMKI